MTDRFPGDGKGRHPKVELWPLTALKPARRNARTHSDRQIAQIKGSFEQFGVTHPILINDEGEIVAGHGRVEAARQLGMTELPVIRLSHLGPEELRAYALADNKIAANAGWDPEILQIELAELSALDLDFDLEITGFSTTEIDLAIGDGEDEPADDENLDELLPAGQCWIRPGDLWLLGEHRLLCGDARAAASYRALMPGELARMVFSDPPYNVRIDGHVDGLGGTKHDEFAMASGEMSPREFAGFLEEVFVNEAQVSINGAIHFQCMDWRHMGEMLEAGEAVYSGLQNLCVWAKDSAGMGSFYRSQHELVFVWKVGTKPHLNTVELGKNGRYRTNVWNYRGASKTGANSELAMHPTVKPVPMIMDAIKDASRRGEIVLDAFGGSGSTLIAAEKTGRRARVIELEPKYCEVTIRRWEKLTGSEAVLESTGATFAATCASREASRAFDLELDGATSEENA
ncbi:site-specific DNA-methyltransferase [Tsuneonella sp. SYSU-LHT278]|uniref:site-specific DNA-methyltransferase n=1 Tax=Tsuneonella sediminis TaxID=3416089 RepID=UPI003F792750